MTKPIVYAHRGASGICPENTMTAFQKAVQLGCQGIECDVQMTKDGELVICHDEYLDRTTNGKGLLKDLTLKEIRQLDAGSWMGESFKGEKIPLLDELLTLVKKSGIWINIELKSGVIDYPNIEEKVISAVKNHSLIDKTIISSFNHYAVHKTKKIEPTIKTAILYMEGLYEIWDYMSQVGCDCAHPFYMAIKPQLAAGIKARGYKINTFTVDNINHAKQLAAMGIDGIITNYPDRILEAFSAM